MYTDGSAHVNSTANARAGAGVWFRPDDDRNIHVRLPGPNQTNNAAEICVVLERWEDNGWIGVSNSDLWKATIAALRKRGEPVFFKWTKGHSGVEGNEGADELASKGASLDDEDASPADTEISHKFDVNGAWLAMLSQSRAYEHIQVTMQHVLDTVAEVNGAIPTASQLWKLIRHKVILHSTHGFLWKALHNAFKYEKRGVCLRCATTEDMEHILMDCSIDRRAILWDLAREIWERKGQEWITPTYSIALGATLVQIRNADGEVDTAATHFYRILMTETMHLIWKIHYEVHNMWIDTLNKRLTIDHLLVNRQRYGSKALMKAKVLSTWRGTLLDEKSLPEDWTNQTRVLVGMVLV
ncbi:ribonuclease H-like protein [Armillaria luteobubalina]|uniref:ribonuclease H n=1 Tax=Armillaria luteobubalina TaxID=153913 RepID=A0AA39NX72_9AGAR|nr:ribonuclease H-like protein [Armillaria luteobubalina]